ncbi:hypothetical protein Gotri_012476 [Gossypium trilobum]|uniref:Uncharacterized protein n=1 Tax=Gossypium trilobum TaxID=34281 RepID=A0A7J9DQH1_9ROSI|nr:hypothetical protein [Gossypium trilobum]
MIEGDGSKYRLSDDRFTKKVRLKDKDIDSDLVMAVDLVVEPTISWKDKLVSKGPGGSRGEIEALGAKLVEEFYFQEGDITSSIVNGYMYKQKVLWEIREMVVKVTKLDFNPNNGARGRFARMAIYVNLDKPLVPQVLINGNIHRVEYKHLPSIYFSCRRYGYRKGVCTNTVSGPVTNMAVVESGGADGPRHMARG